jgi:hypothetical protein
VVASGVAGPSAAPASTSDGLPQFAGSASLYVVATRRWSCHTEIGEPPAGCWVRQAVQ